MSTSRSSILRQTWKPCQTDRPTSYALTVPASCKLLRRPCLELFIHIRYSIHTRTASRYVVLPRFPEIGIPGR